MRGMRALLPVVLFCCAASVAAQSLGTFRTEPARSVWLRAPDAGTVTSIDVELGRAVQADSRLLTFDSPALEAAVLRAEPAVAIAECDLAAARIELDVAEHLARIATRQHRLLGEALPAAEERLEAAKVRAEQVQTLYAAGRASNDDVQQSRLDLLDAQEQWAAIGDDVKNAEDERDIALLHAQKARVDVERAEAQLDAARRDLQLAQRDLDGVGLRAPFDGVVAQTPVTLGSRVDAGARLLHLVDSSTLRIRVQVDADAKIRPGQTVELRRGDEVAPGRIAAAAPVLDKGGRRELHIVVDNGERGWLPGCIVEVMLGGD